MFYKSLTKGEHMEPIRLKETKVVCGNMTISKHVLGRTDYAEKLIEWSLGVPFNTSFKKETPWGLELTFISNGEEPYCLVHLNEEKLSNFLKPFESMSTLQIENYGFGLASPLRTKSHHTDAWDGKEANCFIYISSNEIPYLIGLYFSGEEKTTKFLGKLDISNEFIWTTSDELERSKNTLTKYIALDNKQQIKTIIKEEANNITDEDLIAYMQNMTE